MSFRINTNMSSINAQRHVASQDRKLSHAQAALASGKRIVTAGDDAAGLAISEKFKSQIRSISKAKQNTLDAKSMIQVGEGALGEVGNILVRLKELGVQGSSGTMNDTERGFLDTEAKQLTQEIERIAQSTKYGDLQLLNGTSNDLSLHVGPGSTAENIINMNIDSDATADGLGVESLSLASKGDALDSLEVLDDALGKVGTMRANYGAYQNRLDITESNLSSQHENLSSARSRIIDADIAHESAELSKAQVLQQASTAILASANQSSATALQLL